MGLFGSSSQDELNAAFIRGRDLAKQALDKVSSMNSPFKEIMVTLKPGLFEVTTMIGTSNKLNNLINGVYEELYEQGYTIKDVKYSTSQDNNAFGKNMMHFYSITIFKEN